LAQPSVRCVAPTLIQESGPDARTVESKRSELAGLPSEILLSDAELAELRAIGDNSGSMTLKGASTEFNGGALPDRWALDTELEEVAKRWQITPGRDLTRAT